MVICVVYTYGSDQRHSRSPGAYWFYRQAAHIQNLPVTKRISFVLKLCSPSYFSTFVKIAKSSEQQTVTHPCRTIGLGPWARNPLLTINTIYHITGA